MKYFDKIMSTIKKDADEMPFHDLIRESRDRLGLKQYRAAEHCGMTLGRLRNLESGYYRKLPTKEELEAISEMYEIDINLLNVKAVAHVEQRQRDRKVRVIRDGTSSMPTMQPG